MGNIQEACCGRPSSKKSYESIRSSEKELKREKRKKRKKKRRRRIVHHWPYDSLDGNWMSIRDAVKSGAWARASSYAILIHELER